MFIGDIGANHDGKLERAKELIKLAKEAGLTAVKFQLWDTEKFINKKAFSLLKFDSHQSKWKDGVYETYKKYQLPKEWIPELSKYCQENNIEFLCTAYDKESLDLIDPYVKMHKVGSGEINNYPFLIEIAKKNKPLILSTGATFLNEVIIAVNQIIQINPMIILMQCVTNYENKKDNDNFQCINVLKIYKTLFPDFAIGISSHSKNNKDILAGVCLGAKFFEKHFTDTNSESPDNDFALNPMEWKYLISEVNDMQKILGNTFKEIMPNEQITRIIQRKCLYATKDLDIGHIITENDIIAMRPAMLDGINPDYRFIIGKRINKKLKKDDWLKISDFDIKDFSNV